MRWMILWELVLCRQRVTIKTVWCILRVITEIMIGNDKDKIIERLSHPFIQRHQIGSEELMESILLFSIILMHHCSANVIR